MDSKTIVFSDGSVFELKGTFLEAAKIKYDYPKFDAVSPYDELRRERFSSFLNDLYLLAEQYYKEKKVLTKFGVVNWGDYPAKSEYSTIAELAEDIAYALLREVIMSIAFAELNGTKVIVFGENGITVYDGKTKTVYSSWEEYLSTCCESDNEHRAPIGDDENNIICEHLKHSETTTSESTKKHN